MNIVYNSESYAIVAYPVQQGDHVWVTFLNNWIALNRSEGFFEGLEKKWLGRK